MRRASEQERNAAVLAASEYLERERKRLLYNKEEGRIKDQTRCVNSSEGIRFIKFTPEGDSFGLRTTIGLSTNAVIVGFFSDPRGKTPTLFLGHISGYRPHDFSHQFEESFNTPGKPAKIFYEIIPGIQTDSGELRGIENRVRTFFEKRGIENAKIPPEFQREIKSVDKRKSKSLALLMVEEEKPGDYPFRVALISLVGS